MLGVLEWARKVRWWLVKFRYVSPKFKKAGLGNKPILKTNKSYSLLRKNMLILQNASSIAPK